MTTEPNQQVWKTLRYSDRRVAGALIEKSKTTPDSYPLTLNSLQNACNQKSNRFPQLQLSVDQVFDAVERLQACDAVKETDGDSRAPKYRHKLYDWLGVDKVEVAVMGELLLRGAQTLGELRGRAARMEPIASLADLRPIIDRLYAKGLIVYLSPPGRGCIVTHALYEDAELEKLKSEHGSQDFVAPVPKQLSDFQTSDTNADETTIGEKGESTRSNPSHDEIAELRQEVAELRALVVSLQAKVEGKPTEHCS
jgi:uncharacterized protein YceH (UPF0502 family)